MINVTLVNWLLKPSILLGLAGLAAAILARSSAAYRYAIWRAAFLAAIVVPWLIVSLPDAPLSRSPIPLSRAARAPYSANTGLALAGTAILAPRRSHAAKTAIDPEPVGPRLLFGLWALGAAVVLTRLSAGLLTAATLSKSASPFKAALTPGPNTVPGGVWVSARVSVPCTFGLFRPKVLLPMAANNWTPEQVRLVIVHESIHIRRRDWAWLIFAELMTALYVLNPLVWIARNRLLAECERSCDDEVIDSGVAGHVYAEALIRVARDAYRVPASVVAMARAKALPSRVESILDDRPRRPMNKIGWIGLSIGVLACVFGFATFGSKPAPKNVIFAGSASVGPMPVFVRWDGFECDPVTHRIVTKGPDISAFAPSETPCYGPFRLRDGSKIKLAFVQTDEGIPAGIWKPDGSPVGERDLERAISFDPVTILGTHRSRPIFLRVDIDRQRTVKVGGGERMAYDCAVQVPHTSGAAWITYSNGPDQWLEKILDMATFNAPLNMRTSDMRFGVAYEPYKMVARYKIGEGPLHPIAAPEQMEAGRFYSSACSGTSMVTIGVPPKLRDKELKLIAIDASGNRCPPSRYTLEDAREPGERLPRKSFFFGINSPTEIVAVELQARDYDWVTFTGIHLWPNQN